MRQTKNRVKYLVAWVIYAFFFVNSIIKIIYFYFSIFIRCLSASLFFISWNKCGLKKKDFIIFLIFSVFLSALVREL